MSQSNGYNKDPQIKSVNQETSERGGRLFPKKLKLTFLRRMRSDGIVMTSQPREKQANIDRHSYNITNISFGVFGKYANQYLPVQYSKDPSSKEKHKAWLGEC